jgi:hypothetical protein
MLRSTVAAAPMRLGWHQVLMVPCTSSNTLLMNSRVGSTASASAAPSSPPLQTATARAGKYNTLVEVYNIEAVRTIDAPQSMVKLEVVTMNTAALRFIHGFTAVPEYCQQGDMHAVCLQQQA